MLQGRKGDCPGGDGIRSVCGMETLLWVYHHRGFSPGVGWWLHRAQLGWI